MYRELHRNILLGKDAILRKICEMTFIQHAGILQRIQISQFQFRSDKGHNVCYIMCNFGEDRSTHPKDHAGSFCIFWDRTAKIDISYQLGLSQQVLDQTPMDRATIPYAKSTISHCPPSLITRQRVSINSKTATQTEKCRLLPHIWTIMLKLHLIDLLSICYTSKFATNTVTNWTDGAYALVYRSQSVDRHIFGRIPGQYLPVQLRNFFDATITIKGRLRVASLMLQPFSSKNFKSYWNGAENNGLWEDRAQGSR